MTKHCIFSLVVAPLVIAGAVGCELLSEEPGESVESTTAALYNAPGSTTAPPIDNSVTGVAKITTPDATCVGTLIHPEFLLTSGVGCMRYPMVGPNYKVTFTRADGTTTDSEVAEVWLEPGENYASYAARSSATVTTDVAIVRLSKAMDSSFKPIPLGSTMPEDGTTVRSFGFGAYGKTDCLTVSDGKRRSMDWSWGAAPYRVCLGDWGAPVLRTVNDTTEIVATILHGASLGNVLYHRELIYERMRMMRNGFSFPSPDDTASSHIMSGIKREGPNLGSPLSASSASSCQNECLKNSACKAWNHSGSTCTLKSFAGRWVPDAATSSGLRPVVDSGYKRVGTAIGSAFNVGSATDCAARCADPKASCQAWTYVPETTGDAGVVSAKCTLLSNQGSRVASSSSASGVKPGSVPMDVNLVGGSYQSNAGVSTVTECARLCAEDARCMSYSYQTTQKICLRKNTIPAAEVATGYQSDFKRAFVAPKQNIAGGDVLRDLSDPSKAMVSIDVVPPLPETCRSLCQARSDCLSYQARRPLFGLEVVCTLRTTSSTGYPFKHVEQGLFWDSGYKFLLWQ